ncbi:DUF998 domain-containing protein [Oceanospirillum beijerinckii]|uniref:DUF998 domain-containing protein n=1 Tax=Oceanospirillum beijerinckii TaxID=64976 RepID=UPI00040F6AFA|nr:DUF998 domain-containing protein [Oceanospirillum beijerinckii]
MPEIFNAFGFISVIYLIIGIAITAKFYPGYSHTQQFVSELAAIGSPTQKLSPRLNNYPLSVMFCVFGLSICNLNTAGISEWIAGSSIIVHGLATAVAGFYSMDKDPYIETPSFSGQIHALAGLLVMVSLFIAPLALMFSPLYSRGFQLFSVLCISLSVAFLVATAKAYQSRNNAGLYQRLSYGAQLLWLAGFSLILMVR